MKKLALFVGLAITMAMIALAAGCAAGPANRSNEKPIKSGAAGNSLTATLSNSDGVLRKGKQEFTLTFADSAGKPVDVGAVSLNFFMPAMGSMSAMNNPVTFTTTGTPGVYLGRTDIEMSGEWQAQIGYEGPAGKGKFSIPISAQ